MALNYYDDALMYKIKKWVPEQSNLRVLGPNETKRLFELQAADTKDAAIQLPIVTLSRNNDVELLLNVKNSRSFDGLKIYGNIDVTTHLNVIPVKLLYQLDIYTKTADDGDEYLRNFLFKLINNPLIHIDIPYNDSTLAHVANIRVLETVSNTSDIQEHIFAGQFTRWTIQFELQDAFLFSFPYKKNWKIEGASIQDIETNNEEIVVEDLWNM